MRYYKATCHFIDIVYNPLGTINQKGFFRDALSAYFNINRKVLFRCEILLYWTYFFRPNAISLNLWFSVTQMASSSWRAQTPVTDCKKVIWEKKTLKWIFHEKRFHVSCSSEKCILRHAKVNLLFFWFYNVVVQLAKYHHIVLTLGSKFIVDENKKAALPSLNTTA